MTHTTRVFFATGTTLLALSALLAGNLRRTKVDLGTLQSIGQIRASSPSESMEGLVASKDPQVAIPETNYYEMVSGLVKEMYVDPVTNDRKLVAGAIRGMVASLADPNCLYMDQDEFKAFLNARMGVYEGIGAELVLELSAEDRAAVRTLSSSSTPPDPTEVVRVPRLAVALVVPGGPADKAGVRPGDWVDSVDGRWVVNSDIVRRLRAVQAKAQKDPTAANELARLRKDLRVKSQSNIMPAKARDRLMIGQSGSVGVKWHRGDQIVDTILVKGVSKLPTTEGQVLRPQFVPGWVARLRQAIAGKSSVVLDLRGNVYGDYPSMKACLAVLAPAGTYGTIVRDQGVKATPLKISPGNSKPPALTLLVDSETRGVAEIMALALSSRGHAKLRGTAMAGSPIVSEVVALPDGSGYTLATGRFVVSSGTAGSKS